MPHTSHPVKGAPKLCKSKTIKSWGNSYAPAKGQVAVGVARDGRLTSEYRGRALRWQEIPPPGQEASRPYPPTRRELLRDGGGRSRSGYHRLITRGVWQRVERKVHGGGSRSRCGRRWPCPPLRPSGSAGLRSRQRQRSGKPRKYQHRKGRQKHKN
jgi:hypothetical protein